LEEIMGIMPKVHLHVLHSILSSQLELNNKVPAKPLFFLKPTTSYVSEGNPIIKPNACQVLHHEVELAVVIKGYVIVQILALC
jgi:2-keto-4-pentenoate hydratase/2-oxohepta-3-ene-1,7-dioic acid hydratase in catechol pathway